MYDVMFCGHLVKDEVFQSDGVEKKTIGGIANSWWAHRQIFPNQTAKMIPMTIGEAFIYSDIEASTRISRAVLNAREYPVPSNLKSKWVHLMYLNTLPNPIDVSSILYDTLSADLCGSSGIENIPVELYSRLSCLFASDDDISEDQAKSILTSMKDDAFILWHTKDNCKILTNGFTENIQSHNINSNLNVLGAGDMFAANIIGYLLSSEVIDRNSIRDAVVFSHHQTSYLLEKLNG